MASDDHPWPAPHATTPVDAVVPVPGSKSLTNRALVLAALADGPSTVTGALRARDTVLMGRALASLGVGITGLDGDGPIRVTPQPFAGPAHVDCGLAGTVMRFLPPVAALADGDVRFDGDPRARVRPMGGVIEALEGLGVEVDDDGRRTLPFTVKGTGGVEGGEVTIDASASSQFVSALLLSSPRFAHGVVVRHRGAPVPSMPHIDMSVELLREHGVRVDVDAHDPSAATWTVHPGPVRALDRVVEPDLSNAAPFLAAALVTGGSVTVPGWPARTTQPGDALRELLRPHGRTGLRRSVRPDRERGRPARRPRRRPARRRRADPGPGGGVRPGEQSRRTCAASGTCAVTRPTGSPPSRRRSTTSAATSTRPPTDSSSARVRCTAGSSRPTTTTAWPPRPPSSDSSYPVSPSSTSPPPARRCPGFVAMWASMLEQPRRVSKRRELDEDDVRIRPGRGKSRPRSKERPSHDDASAGFVTAVDRGRFTLALGTPDDPGTELYAVKARELGRKGVVVGDSVGVVGDLSGAPDTLARVVRVEPRVTSLRRSADDDDPIERVLVANADQLVIVTALADPEPRPRMIDRCLVAAYDSGLDPLLVLTKSDLHPADDLLAMYGDLDVPYVVTHRVKPDPLDLSDLAPRLAGRVSVMIGHSGVGKSTLVNALVPDADRAIGRVNAGDRPRPAHVDLGGRAAPARRRLGRRHPGRPVLRARARRPAARHQGVPRPRGRHRRLPARLHPRRGGVRARRLGGRGPRRARRSRRLESLRRLLRSRAGGDDAPLPDEGR